MHEFLLQKQFKLSIQRNSKMKPPLLYFMPPGICVSKTMKKKEKIKKK